MFQPLFLGYLFLPCFSQCFNKNTEQSEENFTKVNIENGRKYEKRETVRVSMEYEVNKQQFFPSHVLISVLFFFRGLFIPTGTEFWEEY